MNITRVEFTVDFNKEETDHVEQLEGLVSDFVSDFDLPYLTELRFWLNSGEKPGEIFGSVSLHRPPTEEEKKAAAQLAHMAASQS